MTIISMNALFWLIAAIAVWQVILFPLLTIAYFVLSDLIESETHDQ